MKVALLQLCAGENKTANVKKALRMAQQALAKGAGLVLLPEVFNFRSDGKNKELFLQAAEKIPGPSTSAFAALARRHKAAFVLGSILEKAPGKRSYNTSIFIDPLGRITAKYRKIHLFDANFGDSIIKEEDRLRAGRRRSTAKAGEFTVGLSICYDLRFPDLYQGYGRRGIEILTVPSCFTKKTGEAHWEVLLRARAIENLCYVLAPNQVGKDKRGIEAYGHSMIISPWGEIIACASGGAQEIIFGDIDVREVKKARAILPGIIGGRHG